MDYNQDFNQILPMIETNGTYSQDWDIVSSTEYEENDYLIEQCLYQIFEHLSTQDLLNVSLVNRKWNEIARQHLTQINHVKVISETNGFRFEPCCYLPTKLPCSRQKYFITSLAPYTDLHFELSYFDQIDLILDRLKDNTITSLDINGCPRNASALAFLLRAFQENLECLTMDKIGCLVNYSYDVWKIVNSLPKLRKLALIQLGTIPEDMPILEQLEEFHLATTNRNFDSNLLILLLYQLSDRLRKLSLNLPFSMQCFIIWSRKQPSIMNNITHLELYLKSKLFAFECVTTYFTSLTHLTLLLPDDSAIYLDVFYNLPNFKLLRHLHLIEDSKDPINGLISAIKAKTFPTIELPSVISLHLEVSLKDYRTISCLFSIFPNLREISFKSLNIDSYCICVGDDSAILTECDICRHEFKKLLEHNFSNIRIYGIESDSYYENLYAKEDWTKCRYQWL
ncbi:hypothetical protein RDWZM_005391 [Blomia tropicalis]|uniref:F-box domain-containing protein n=1 Tax=Blomia tropicalis TaxID=40697 RepID=A0A9Q0RMA6_BLOTA|nr:hypothetical protein RDWZM_005391 [Blomia tropicalis]